MNVYVLKNFDENSFEYYAFERYNNPQCSGLKEFKEDLSKFKYIKKAINRYLTSGEVTERLLLNHIIALHNVFDNRTFLEMMEFKMSPEHWPVLKACFLALGYIDENKYSDIPLDRTIVEKLEAL